MGVKSGLKMLFTPLMFQKEKHVPFVSSMREKLIVVVPSYSRIQYFVQRPSGFLF